MAFDPCYHAKCDTLANLNLTGLEQMADGAAHATLAMNTESVNGRPGKGNFKPDSPAPARVAAVR